MLQKKWCRIFIHGRNYLAMGYYLAVPWALPQLALNTVNPLIFPVASVFSMHHLRLHCLNIGEAIVPLSAILHDVPNYTLELYGAIYFSGILLLGGLTDRG